MRDMVRKHVSLLKRLKSNLSRDDFCQHQSAVKARLMMLNEKAVPLQDCAHQALFIM